MRFFLAINLPAEVKDVLAAELPRFVYLKFRAIPAENWHITLKFIGEANSSLWPIIKEALCPIVEQFNPFVLEVSSAGFLDRRIFVFNCERSSQLFALFKMIDQRLAAAKVASSEGYRFFHPHITVGRKNPPFRGQLHSVRHFDLKTRERVTFKVESVDLMKSTLTPDGAIYKTVKSFSFSSNTLLKHYG